MIYPPHITFLPWFRDSSAGCSGQEAAPLHSHMSAEEMGSITDYIAQSRKICYIGKKPAAAAVYLGHEQPGGLRQAVINQVPVVVPCSACLLLRP